MDAASIQQIKPEPAKDNGPQTEKGLVSNSMKSNASVTLLELNEVSIDFVRQYVGKSPDRYKNLVRLLKIECLETTSESAYKNLEPWIQWVSAHSGMTADEHGIFRLGDAIRTEFPQILCSLDRLGVSVGAVSPMNMANQTPNAAYFIPDPWTQTPTDGSLWSRLIWDAISQAVNDNAHRKVKTSSLTWLALAFMRFANRRHFKIYWKLLANSRGAPWRKALFLDLFLNDVYQNLQRNKKARFSILFLNAGAHIQHHYLFNAQKLDQPPIPNPKWYIDPAVDPFGEMLDIYDTIVGEHLDCKRDLIIATGLSQIPYDRVEFYYRLKNHEQFFSRFGISFSQIIPRMTRDFLVECHSSNQADQVAEKLADIRSSRDGEPIFGEIDHRGTSLFVTLTYPKEISENFLVENSNGVCLDLHRQVSFVAIKNGMHSSRGFMFFRGEVAKFAPPSGSHIKCLHDSILGFFRNGAATR